ncbi:MAG: TIR domain-containing protein [Phycisphaerae bacterium]
MSDSNDLLNKLNGLASDLGFYSADIFVGMSHSDLDNRRRETWESTIGYTTWLEDYIPGAVDRLVRAGIPARADPLIHLLEQLPYILGFVLSQREFGLCDGDKAIAKQHSATVAAAITCLQGTKSWIDSAGLSEKHQEPAKAVGAATCKAGRFAVAFSFPGEKRDYVKAIDECLTKSMPNESVFYDNRFKAELARPNLDTHLQEIYSNAELVVVFLCADYQRKQWCGLEWRAIRSMIGKKLDAKIMLFRFDNAKVDGAFDIDGYIDAGTHPPEEAVKLILQRLGSNPQNPKNGESCVGNAQRSHLVPAQAPGQYGGKEATDLRNLREEFAKLSEMKDRNAAGLAFEKLLTSLFGLFGLAPRAGFRVIGEQIDGAFELDHEIYLVEAKWEQNPMAEAELLVFRGKIEGKSPYTRGVFIAINGISKPAEQAITTGKQASFFLVDGYDLNAVLEGKIPLDTLLRNKQRRLAEEGKIMARHDEF